MMTETTEAALPTMQEAQRAREALTRAEAGTPVWLHESRADEGQMVDRTFLCDRRGREVYVGDWRIRRTIDRSGGRPQYDMVHDDGHVHRL